MRNAYGNWFLQHPRGSFKRPTTADHNGLTGFKNARNCVNVALSALG